MSKFGEIADFIIMWNPTPSTPSALGSSRSRTTAAWSWYLGSPSPFFDGSAVDVKKRQLLKDMPKKDHGSRGEHLHGRTSFIGRLNYDTNDTVLKAYFEKFGELSDCIVMRYPDSKR